MLTAFAQTDDREFNQMNEDGSTLRRKQGTPDSLGTKKEIPKGYRVWTVDQRFGDITPAKPDTLSHMFMNTIFTTGLRGEYNSLGNLGSPRINRIFIDREETSQFFFTQPYSFFIRPVEQFHFTNTLSPITNLSYNSAGDRTNGENHLTTRFGVNAGKKIGVGFIFDYLYGRGYYSDQSTSHFNYTMYGSYLGDRYQAHLLVSTNHEKVSENGGITDDFHITHPESFDDDYQTSEIPTVLTRNWNRNDNQHVFLSHRYIIGFNRKVPMTQDEIKARRFAIESEKDNKKNDEDSDNNDDQKNMSRSAGRPDNAKIVKVEDESATTNVNDNDNENENENGNVNDRIQVKDKATADSLIAKKDREKADTTWMKNEYVPVTSFIHTMKFDNYRRIYQAYETPAGYYADTYDIPSSYTGDSIYDKTRHYQLRNTFAISLLEGFNKWAKAGVKAFVTSDLRHFTLPDSISGESSYNEHNLSIGGQLIKSQGRALHYNATAETWLTGKDAGQLKVDATADLRFRLFGDTVTLAASGFFHLMNPVFYYRNYHSKHFWWDNDNLDKTTHTRLQGLLAYDKTRTKLRVSVDELTDYVYLGMSYDIGDNGIRTNNTVSVCQQSSAINVLTASLTQDFTLGPANLEAVVTYQHSSDDDALPLPTINVYGNLYLRFMIAHVLKCDLGADVRYFTSYHAPDYSPALSQFAVQQGEQKTDIGNYPIVNAYANFHLKQARFFVMFSHVNAGMGSRNYFLVPHYPLNERILRLGISWTFFN